MSSVALTWPARSLPSPAALAGLALAAGIAWLQPFDVIFAAVTFGQPVLRAGLIVVLALAGVRFAKAIGLDAIKGRDGGSLVFPVVVAAGVAVVCALFDRGFEAVLHPGYVRLIAGEPLALRTLGFMMRAVNENIIYRLFLGTALAWALGQAWRRPDGGPAPGAIWSAFALAQAINVGANVTLLAPITPLALLHDGLRYFAPGLVWTWIYLRRGFLANEVASTSVHLFFQPLVGVLLAP